MVDALERPPPARMIFEEDEAFSADLLQEAQMDGEEPDEGDFDDEDLYGPTVHLTGPPAGQAASATSVVSGRSGVKEGKRPAVKDPMEDDEDEFEFGQEELITSESLSSLFSQHLI